MSKAKLILSVFALYGGALVAQPPAALTAPGKPPIPQEIEAADAGEAVFQSESRLVEVHTTVTDKSGALMTGLPQSSFRVFENDVPQEIKVFRSEDAPVSLGLIIDSSASMLVRKDSVNEAALKLVRASNKEDEVFVMTFSDKVNLVQDFTHDIAHLERSLKTIQPNGPTAMRDALALGLEHLRRLGKNDKKMLLVVTDGEDNSSFDSLQKVERMAQQDGILIYAIGLLSTETERSATNAKHDLDTMTLATGGEVFYPTELSEVAAIAEHVAKDLRNQYTIAYNPTNEAQDGTFRKIKVTVTAPGAVVRTRSGYFAEGGARAKAPGAGPSN